MAYSTFDLVYFEVLRSTEQVVQAESTLIHIPGGNVNVLDAGGQLERRLPLILFFDDGDQYTALQDLVGTTADLIIVDETLSDVYLSSLSRTRIFADGEAVATAEFILP